jgi:protoheme IX farnesyltransferase
MGYAAARGEIFTPGGIYLFLILFFWQMPHFWVLALRFQKDYAQGGFPTLPVAHGTGITVNHIVLWCLAYVGLAILGPLFLQVKAAYCIPTFLMSVKVLWELSKFVKEPEGKKWLHFFLWVNFSLIVYLGAAVVDIWGSYWLPMLTK